MIIVIIINNNSNKNSNNNNSNNNSHNNNNIIHFFWVKSQSQSLAAWNLPFRAQCPFPARPVFISKMEMR